MDNKIDINLDSKVVEKNNDTTYYRDIEQAIIRYTIDETQTAGELTREILEIIKHNRL